MDLYTSYNNDNNNNNSNNNNNNNNNNSNKKKLYSIQKEAEKFRREFEVSNLDRAANKRVTKFARRVKQKVKEQAKDIEVKQWEEKELHGRYPKRIREADVDDKTNQ